jgi:hypothetical protein
MRLPFSGLFAAATAAIAALPIGDHAPRVSARRNPLPAIATPLTPARKFRSHNVNDSRAFSKRLTARRAASKRARAARRAQRSR